MSEVDLLRKLNKELRGCIEDDIWKIRGLEAEVDFLEKDNKRLRELLYK